MAGVESKRRRRRLVSVVQYGAGVLALAWLLQQADLVRLAELAGGLDASTVLALLAVTGVGLVGRFYLWYVLVNRVSASSFAAAADVDLVVNFLNQLLPSRISGRAAAPLVLRGRTGMRYAEAVAVAGVHTGLYAAFYAVGALTGIGFGIGTLPTPLLLLLALSTGLYFAAGAFVLIAGTRVAVADRVVDVLAGSLRHLPAVGDRLSGAARSLPAFTTATAERFRSLAGDPGVLLSYGAGFAVAMAVAPGLRVWLVLESMGVDSGLGVLIPVYLLAAYSVTLLPLTPGGIGVSEATATAVFVALGVPAAVIVPVVFLDRLLGVYLPALAGWYPSIRLDLSGLVPEGDRGKADGPSAE